jgi:hypothetical protein
MTRIQKPHYNLHQIQTGLYSSGGEFTIKTGEEYIGSYHILPTNQKFSGFRPEPTSVELFELRLNPTPDILRYNQITGNEINRYNPPISFSPNPNADDYKRNKIERFFVQKRNSPLNTIVEIDQPQFASVNTQNNPGINGVIWNKVRLDWIISKIPINDAEYLNSREIQKNLINFPHLDLILTNTLEFYR